MRLAMISGDGLPVSGLLTTFRNVVELARDDGLLELPVPADLGYSWRPDKPTFYPAGAGAHGYPDWLRVTSAVPVPDAPAGTPPGPDADDVAGEWLALRSAVADAHLLDAAARADLRRRVAALATPYERHFTAWFAEHDADWVIAMNMTLSDATPVTLALHRAARRRWGGGRPGGVVFWDHDLFASYAVHEGAARVYPTGPNEFTPVPQDVPYHRWVVPTEELAAECPAYPTRAKPLVVPLVLPTVRPATMADPHREFLAQRGVPPGVPVVLAPVRVFRVKGVEISVALLAAVRREAARRGEPPPHLLVFGTLDEDPEYAAEVLAALRQAPEGVHFLGGVPLSTHRDDAGRWHLDEVDLLRVAAATCGGVFYTPNRPDVESVGLGPALAAVAGVPFATTAYNALDGAYDGGLDHVHVADPSALDAPAAEFVDQLAQLRAGSPQRRAALARNRETVARSFPPQPWRRLLAELAGSVRVTPR
ncbi:hypothetical protein [Micromonospora sp. DT233]|uniref:hypothetical protein n=1 Tax=Micromonospora sp. DT233 TaxID=3393432 RepID=UPI003CF864CE